MNETWKNSSNSKEISPPHSPLIFPVVELGDVSDESCVKLARKPKDSGRRENMLLKLIEILFIPVIIFYFTRDKKEDDTYEQK